MIIENAIDGRLEGVGVGETPHGQLLVLAVPPEVLMTPILMPLHLSNTDQ